MTVKNAENKTKPRATKGTIAVPEEITPKGTATPVVVEANGTPAAVASPDTGTANIAATLPAADKLDASPAAAVIAAAAANAAPLAVPTLPNPNAPTGEQITAFKATIQGAYLEFFKLRPNAQDVPAFTMPDDDAIEELAMAYRAEKAKLDPPVKVSLVAAFNHVQDDLKRQAMAAEAAAKNQAPIADLWAGAALVVLSDVAANVKSTISTKRAVKTVTDGAVRESKPRSVSGSEADKAKKLIAYCQSKGLEHVDLIDAYKKGYQGNFHCVRLLADGRYEKLNYDPDTFTTTATGEIIDNWKYFLSNDGKAPQYSRHQMHGILDVDQVLERPEPVRAKWAKHLADLELVIGDANK